MSATRKSSLFVAVFLGMFVSSAHAQDSITAKVPFPFIVGHETFPAGQYDIRTADYGDVGFLIKGMNNTNNRSAAFVLTIPAPGDDPAGDQPALTFTRDANQYRLVQIWESSNEGRALIGLPPAPRIGRAETQAEPAGALTYVLPANWK